MLAKPVPELPEGDLLFEPKWDGFRCIVFRDHDEVVLGSRNERPLTRYFPELVEAIRTGFPQRCVVDGEIVVASPEGRADFDLLSQRIHPAGSRIRRLAAELPASFVAFDLLALDDRALLEAPLRDRRALLDRHLADLRTGLHRSPATTDRALAAHWFARFEGAGIDGVMAKPIEGTYEPGRRVQYKLKHRRSADCVVGGFRMHRTGDGVGSLLLGLHDHAGILHHVGVATSFSATRRVQLIAELSPYLDDALADHPWRAWADPATPTTGRMPGTVSRWSGDRDGAWTPVRPERVCEVAYDQLQGDRFRHPTRFVRWRPDKRPGECTYDQLEPVASCGLAEVFAATGS